MDTIQTWKDAKAYCQNHPGMLPEVEKHAAISTFKTYTITAVGIIAAVGISLTALAFASPVAGGIAIGLGLLVAIATLALTIPNHVKLHLMKFDTRKNDNRILKDMVTKDIESQLEITEKLHKKTETQLEAAQRRLNNEVILINHLRAQKQAQGT